MQYKPIQTSDTTSAGPEGTYYVHQVYEPTRWIEPGWRDWPPQTKPEDNEWVRELKRHVESLNRTRTPESIRPSGWMLAEETQAPDYTAFIDGKKSDLLVDRIEENDDELLIEVISYDRNDIYNFKVGASHTVGIKLKGDFIFPERLMRLRQRSLELDMEDGDELRIVFTM